MHTELKIEFRKLTSEVFMYMCEKGHSESEIIEMLVKYEDMIIQLINAEVSAMLPTAPWYPFSVKNRVDFRKLVAVSLNELGKSGIKPERVLEVIKTLETWVDNLTEENLRHAMGKPSMKIKNLPN